MLLFKKNIVSFSTFFENRKSIAQL